MKITHTGNTYSILFDEREIEILQTVADRSGIPTEDVLKPRVATLLNEYEELLKRLLRARIEDKVSKASLEKQKAVEKLLNGP